MGKRFNNKNRKKTYANIAITNYEWNTDDEIKIPHNILKQRAIDGTQYRYEAIDIAEEI